MSGGARRGRAAQDDAVREPEPPEPGAPKDGPSCRRLARASTQDGLPGTLPRGRQPTPHRILVFCAGPSNERARPLIQGLQDAGVTVEVRSDEDVARMSQDSEPPVCDAVLLLWSFFFKDSLSILSKFCERAAAAGALVLNDVSRLVEMQDRDWLLREVRKQEVPTPEFVTCLREDGRSPTLEEHEDYIVIDGKRISKPFVEKPVDRRNRDIYVYYPKDAGGGRALVATRESGDVQYVCDFEQTSRVRTESSFIYQEYFQNEGFVVQAVCVGGFAYGNAVPSGMFARASGAYGGESFCPVILRQEEKRIAQTLHRVFKQALFGITFVRTQTRSNKSATSYVIDVWTGIPRGGLGAHRNDVARALLAAIRSQRAPGRKWKRSRSSPNIAETNAEGGHEELHEGTVTTPCRPPPCSVAWPPGGGGAADHQPHISRETSSEENAAPVRHLGTVSEAGEEEDQLLCVLLVARHGERTPKQKVKVKVRLKSEFRAGWLCAWIVGSGAGAAEAVSPPETLELRCPHQLERLASAARELASAGHEVETLEDALKYTADEGMLCHAKVCASGPTLAVGLKWGGELTHAGAERAEALGLAFRGEMYPNEDIDELHATLRHDVKVYSSRDRRCQQTAAAFCRGMMKIMVDKPTHFALPPIIAALVRTDGRLEGVNNYAAEDEQRARVEEESAPEPIPVDAPWKELEARLGGFRVPELLLAFGTAESPASPAPALRALRGHLEELTEALNSAEPRRALYGGETPTLLRERYKDALGDLGSPEEPPRFGKVLHVMDHLQYDHSHNVEAVPARAVAPLRAALPLCEALCDVVAAADAVQERAAAPRARSHGVALLSKMRWDLRVASGEDLGHETAHLQKHEALYKAVESTGAPAERPCVRTRLYFSHNSQLHGLLQMLTRARGGQGLPGSEVGGDQVLELLRTRQGFLSHFAVTLRRRFADGSLHVACDFATEGTGRRRRLFDMPLDAADAWWSELLDERGGPGWLEGEDSCPGGDRAASPED